MKILRSRISFLLLLSIFDRRASSAFEIEMDIKKAQQSRVAPSEVFKTGSHAEKWGTYDDSGKPLTTKEGEPLSKTQSKSINKELKNHEKAHGKLVKTAGEQGVDAYIESLVNQLEELKLSVPN